MLDLTHSRRLPPGSGCAPGTLRAHLRRRAGLAAGLAAHIAFGVSAKAEDALAPGSQESPPGVYRENARGFLRAHKADEQEGAEEAARLKCPMPTGGTDGCLDAPPATFTLSPCFGKGGHFLDGGQSWDHRLGPHPPAWNVPGCDYKIGATTSKAVMLAASTADFEADQSGRATRVRYDPWLDPPAGCARQPFPASPWPWSDISGVHAAMPYLVCGAGPEKRISFANYYMGAQNNHEAVGVYVKNSVSSLSFANVIFDADDATTAGIVNRHLGVHVGQVYTEGGSAEDILLRNVSVLGNFNNGSECCDAGWGTVLFFNTTGTITVDYSAFYHIQQYVMNFSVSGNHLQTLKKGSLEFLHSLVEGCTYRPPIGHAECFTGGYAFERIHIAYNVLRWPPQGGTHQAFFHINSYANPAAPDLGNDSVEIDHNLALSNSIVPHTSQIAPRVGDVRNVKIQYHLDHGVFTLDDYPKYANGDLAHDVLVPTIQLKKGFFTLWKQLGHNKYGPKFSIDCPSDQPKNPYCPADAKPPSGTAYNVTTDHSEVITDTIYNTTANFFHDWYYVPTAKFSAHDNFVDLEGVGAGWMAAPKYCGPSQASPAPAILSNNVNLQRGDGTEVNSLYIRPGTGRGC